MQLNVPSLLAQNSGNPGRKLTPKELHALEGALRVAAQIYEKDGKEKLAEAQRIDEHNAALAPCADGERRLSSEGLRSLARQFVDQREEVLALMEVVADQDVYVIDAEQE